MSAMTHRLRAAEEQGNPASSLHWAALADASHAVAMMAGIQPDRPQSHVRNFPALIRDAAPWRSELADAAIADLAAMMETGLSALLAIHARGGDPRTAARALWQEYLALRGAIVALLPQDGGWATPDSQMPPPRLNPSAGKPASPEHTAKEHFSGQCAAAGDAGGT